jgi:hypothetical protein
MKKLIPALGLCVLACQPAAPLTPTLLENAASLHQGGVVFLGLLTAAATPKVQLVTLDGTVVEGKVEAGGRFRVASLREAVVALRVEADGRMGYVEHDSGGGVTRHWVRGAADREYEVGTLRFTDGHFSSERSVLAELDSDADGTSDQLDLDDDNDGLLDRDDPDDAGHGFPDDRDPLRP